MKNDAACVEDHRETFSRALRMPYHANPPVAGLAALLGNGSSPTCQGSAQCLLQRHMHRVELMVSGHLLGEHSATRVLEYDEVTNQIEESVLFENAFQ